jgi:endonuclease III-like uncharacterized protein
MPLYVYACDNLEHTERRSVVKAMLDEPSVLCSVCGYQMHRVPQPFRFYNSPFEVLTDKLINEFHEYKATKKKVNRRNHADQRGIRT